MSYLVSRIQIFIIISSRSLTEHSRSHSFMTYELHELWTCLVHTHVIEILAFMKTLLAAAVATTKFISQNTHAANALDDDVDVMVRKKMSEENLIFHHYATFRFSFCMSRDLQREPENWIFYRLKKLSAAICVTSLMSTIILFFLREFLGALKWKLKLK